MRVAKLDKRYKAYKQGFRHAIVFDDFLSSASAMADDISKVYTAIEKLGIEYEESWSRRPDHGQPREFVMWTCIKTEQEVTMILLAAENED